MFASTVLK